MAVQSHVMRTYTRADLEPVRGEGCYLFGSDGRRYLDFLAGVAVNAFGHCHPRLVEALCGQARLLWHSSNLVQVPGQEAVASRLCRASFADQVFFTNSGAESVDFALKLVRRFSKTTDRPERWRTVTFSGGFHGRTMAVIAAGGQRKLTQGYEPLVPGFDCVPFGDLGAAEAAIGPETAAILFEPVQGEGGVRVLPAGSIAALREIADRHGLLLVADEVQTGFGRTGELFGFTASGIVPDIVACAKALGAGFPLGAVLTTRAVGACAPQAAMDLPWADPRWPWRSPGKCWTCCSPTVSSPECGGGESSCTPRSPPLRPGIPKCWPACAGGA